MSSRTMLLAACAAAPLLLAPLPAAPANGIGGPVSGFVVDGRSRHLRPINGLPGSATLGAPVQLPFAAGLAVVATGKDYAIVTDAHGTGEPFLARGLASGTPTVAPISGAIAVTQALLADSGTAAALYSQAAGRLQFLSGLPDQPQAGDPLDLGPMNSTVAAMALDSAGRTALLVAADGGIYWANAQGLHFIVSAPGTSSVSFLPNGQDAVVGNRQTGDVLLIRGFSGSAAVSTLAGAGNGITSALAVRGLNDHEAGVVNADGRLAVVNLDNSAVSWVDLAGKADRFEAVDSDLLVLNHPGTDPLLLLDLTQGRSTYFVPPDPTSNSELHKGKDLWKR